MNINIKKDKSEQEVAKCFFCNKWNNEWNTIRSEYRFIMCCNKCFASLQDSFNKDYIEKEGRNKK